MDKLCKDLGKMNIVEWKKSVPQKKKKQSGRGQKTSSHFCQRKIQRR